VSPQTRSFRVKLSAVPGLAFTRPLLPYPRDHGRGDPKRREARPPAGFFNRSQGLGSVEVEARLLVRQQASGAIGSTCLRRRGSRPRRGLGERPRPTWRDGPWAGRSPPRTPCPQQMRKEPRGNRGFPRTLAERLPIFYESPGQGYGMPKRRAAPPRAFDRPTSRKLSPRRSRVGAT